MEEENNHLKELEVKIKSKTANFKERTVWNIIKKRKKKKQPIHCNGKKIIKKCRCIKESSWFLIDDSFNKNPKIKNSKHTFQVDNIYDYQYEDVLFGKSFNVIHRKYRKEKTTGFDEKRFFEHFEIINS